MISIIIPVYNVEKFLPQCLESILSQTYQDFEVILIDDGSPDNSGAICDEYAKKDSRFIVVHQQNAGVSIARNKGIDIAKGEWITFIDSDDWIEPSYLANFKLEESSNIDLIIQGLEYYNNRNGHFFNFWSFNECIIKKENFQKVFTENRLLELGFPIGKAYKKILLTINNLRFDIRISFHEDHIFVLDYYKLCNTIRLIDAKDYKYRCYHSGTTLSSKRHPWDKMNLAGDEMITRFEEMRVLFYPENSETERLLFTFAYNCKISSSESIVLSSLSFIEKKKIFKKVINKREIKKYYHPTSTRYKLIKHLYIYYPYIFVYVFFHFIQLIKKIK